MLANEKMMENPLRAPPSKELAKAIEMRSNPMLTMLTEKVIINDDDEDKEKKLHVVIDAENVDKLEIKDKEIKDEERPKDIHVIIDKAEPEELNGLYKLLSYRDLVSLLDSVHQNHVY